MKQPLVQKDERMYTQCRDILYIPMTAKIKKWGNSLAIRIPKTYALEAKLVRDSVIQLKVIRGKIIIKKVEQKPYNFEELVSKIQSKNRHSEIGTGKHQGREVW